MPDFCLTAGYVEHKCPTYPYPIHVAQATHAFYLLRLLRPSEKKTDNLPTRSSPPYTCYSCYYVLHKSLNTLNLKKSNIDPVKITILSSLATDFS